MKWPWTETVDIEQEDINPVATETAVAIAESGMSVPVVTASMKSSLSEEERTEYARVCAEIGYTCGDLIREKLKAFLHDEGIHIYNHKQVVAYLDEQLGNDWEWRGLRQADVDELGASGNWHTTGEPRHVNFAVRPYRGAIPLPVLLTIQKIQKAVPEVFFYISSPKNNDGAPFLMVTTRSMGQYVIERWDEPSFRER